MSNKKIYVGNISFDTTEEDLKNEFSEYGDIDEVKIIIDHQTNRSKGFGFITFATPEAMEASLAKNGEEVQGRKLRVNQAEERKPRTDRRF
ncbi:MAG: RNA-binding protein [Rickettsiales bacterium]|nr:RNA-binding protein [Rickettsiales bacterium]|tara:strand:+ start:279 stop:551 length:273 start_codon:yes stop_codon:yes gene_type:complete